MVSHAPRGPRVEEKIPQTIFDEKLVTCSAAEIKELVLEKKNNLMCLIGKYKPDSSAFRSALVGTILTDIADYLGVFGPKSEKGPIVGWRGKNIVLVGTVMIDGWEEVGNLPSEYIDWIGLECVGINRASGRHMRTSNWRYMIRLK